LCSWFFSFNPSSYGSSLFGNATVASLSEDNPAYTTYTAPFFLFSGAGGSDEIYFPQAGVYLLQFTFNTFLISSVNAVDVVSNSLLSGVTVLGSSTNYTAPSSSNRLLSFDIISSLPTGVIAFPTQVALLALYGSNWSGCRVGFLNVTRLY